MWVYQKHTKIVIHFGAGMKQKCCPSMEVYCKMLVFCAGIICNKFISKIYDSIYIA